MSLFTRQLSFVGNRLSFSTISSATKIPYRQTLAMRRGVIKPTTAQSRAMSNLYRKEAYASAREAGVPVKSARTLSAYSPEHLKIKLAEVDLYINDLTTGHIVSKVDDFPGQTVQEVIDNLFGGIKDNIKKAIRESRRDIESIMEFGIT